MPLSRAACTARTPTSARRSERTAAGVGRGAGSSCQQLQPKVLSVSTTRGPTQPANNSTGSCQCCGCRRAIIPCCRRGVCTFRLSAHTVAPTQALCALPYTVNTHGHWLDGKFLAAGSNRQKAAGSLAIQIFTHGHHLGRLPVTSGRGDGAVNGCMALLPAHNEARGTVGPAAALRGFTAC